MDKLTICAGEVNAQPSQACKQRPEYEFSDTHWSHSADSLVLIVGQTKVPRKGALVAHSKRLGFAEEARRGKAQSLMRKGGLSDQRRITELLEDLCENSHSAVSKYVMSESAGEQRRFASLEFELECERKCSQGSNS
ncbi:hypothetical protein Q7C36_014353 [Tachysurus vachellii]|uniref:Uncharacterized protein n=1 Tax=Tachysurus vachellii TaxID=175792 RepID=A0AA88MHJ7_TACVA|nr:hypothetical protein Q7C36_014353 [Tachysurus vachellii]